MLAGQNAAAGTPLMRSDAESAINAVSRSQLDIKPSEMDNISMQLHGLVQNGVIILCDGLSLPEGTPVTVSCSLESSTRPPSAKKRVQLPLVRTGEPGSMHLNNERIAEILDEEDVASARDRKSVV